MSPDPRCSVCGNAYGTRYRCKPCREDPANDGWCDPSDLELSALDGDIDRVASRYRADVVHGTPRPQEPSDLYDRAAAVLMAEPRIKPVLLARRLECSERQARVITRALRKVCDSIMERERERERAFATPARNRTADQRLLVEMHELSRSIDQRLDEQNAEKLNLIRNLRKK